MDRRKASTSNSPFFLTAAIFTFLHRRSARFAARSRFCCETPFVFRIVNTSDDQQVRYSSMLLSALACAIVAADASNVAASSIIILVAALVIASLSPASLIEGFAFGGLPYDVSNRFGFLK